MSLQLPQPIDRENSLLTYTLTAAQELQGRLLSSETRARIESAATSLTKDLAAFRFSGPESARTEQMLQHAYMQGARDKLLDLVNDADLAFFEIASDQVQK